MKNPILMVSPIPSHPQFQGNSARIYRMGRLFQLAGHPVHFVYFGLEGLTEKDRIANQACWDAFHYVQPNGPVANPSQDDYFHVDDWYDNRVGDLVESLSAKWNYAACLVHYVWFSKVLERLPKNVLKMIDTHDVFGDRHLVAREAGFEPVWFYTSKRLEAEGLHRADLVLAIQDEEAEYFRTIVKKPVLSIGYLIPEQWLPSPPSHPEQKLRLGYLGSGNPFNVESIRLFENEVSKYPELLDRYEFHLAGAVCGEFEANEQSIFKCWGVVDDVADFYECMDVLLNPMVGGTGLKIKSVEVMAYKRPLLATRDAMVGICEADEPTVFNSPLRMVEMLLAKRNSQCEVLGVAPSVWKKYVKKTSGQYKDLLQRVSAGSSNNYD